MNNKFACCVVIRSVETIFLLKLRAGKDHKAFWRSFGTFDSVFRKVGTTLYTGTCSCIHDSGKIDLFFRGGGGGHSARQAKLELRGDVNGHIFWLGNGRRFIVPPLAGFLVLATLPTVPDVFADQSFVLREESRIGWEVWRLARAARVLHDETTAHHHCQQLSGVRTTLYTNRPFLCKVFVFVFVFSAHPPFS